MYIIVPIRYGGYLKKIYFILFDILCPLYMVYDHMWNPYIERYDDTINLNNSICTLLQSYFKLYINFNDCENRNNFDLKIQRINNNQQGRKV